MGRIRGWVKRLERAIREDLAAELLDGSRYYFDTVSPTLFMHWHDCITAGSAHNWPPAPEIMHKVCGQRPGGSTSAGDGERRVQLACL